MTHDLQLTRKFFPRVLFAVCRGLLWKVPRVFFLCFHWVQWIKFLINFVKLSSDDLRIKWNIQSLWFREDRLLVNTSFVLHCAIGHFKWPTSPISIKVLRILMDLLVDDNFSYSSSLVLEHNPVIHLAVQQLTLKATAGWALKVKEPLSFLSKSERYSSNALLMFVLSHSVMASPLLNWLKENTRRCTSKVCPWLFLISLLKSESP